MTIVKTSAHAAGRPWPGAHLPRGPRPGALKGLSDCAAPCRSAVVQGSLTTVNQKPSTLRTMDWNASSPTGLVT